MVNTFPVGVLLLLLITSVGSAQLIPLAADQHLELGDIGSDGNSGRQLHVREQLANEIHWNWVFFPPHSQLPDTFPDPTPPSPSQGDISLTDMMSLVVVIPQLQHKPIQGLVDAEYQRSGNIITIDASLHTGSSITATIYGPHEYLLPIGQLPAGDYRLHLNLARTTDFSDAVVTTTGFMDFHVSGVPEPGGSPLLLVAATMASWLRPKKKRTGLISRG